MDTIDGMRTFVAVAAQESFTGGARRLGITTRLASKYIRQLEERLEILQAQLEEQGVNFERLQNRPPERRPVVPPPSDSFVIPGSDAAGDTAGATLGGPPVEDSMPPGGENELYDAAYRDFTRGNYQLAIAGFEDFLQHYPDSDLADNAQYWLAETYYVQRQFTTALPAFELVVNSYPNSIKLPDALLKIGFCNYELSQWDQARTALERVVREFPDTTAARLATQRLERMAQDQV